MKELALILRELARDAGAPRALATVVAVEGSSYRRAGARLLVNADGSSLGSISGGCLEADVLERAGQVIATSVAQTVSYDTTPENDLVWGTGLGCQGVVRLLIEPLTGTPAWAEALRRNFAERRATNLEVVWDGVAPAQRRTQIAAPDGAEGPTNATIFHQRVPPPTRLLIFGAGEDARPLTHLAHELGWHAEVFDPRPALATPGRFPDAAAVHLLPPEAAATVALDDWTVAVIMSHRYAFDSALAAALLPRNLPYVGMLGPRRRTERILSELAGGGLALTGAQRARLHAPVGLDLGGDTPETVALAILAEIQAVLAGRDARPLRDRAKPIHA